MALWSTGTVRNDSEPSVRLWRGIWQMIRRRASGTSSIVGHRPLPPLFNRKAVHSIVAEILNSDLLGFLVSSSLRLVRNRGHNRLEAVLA